MVKEIKLDMECGDEAVIRDKDTLAVTVERTGLGYAIVAKASGGRVLLSEFLPNESA